MAGEDGVNVDREAGLARRYLLGAASDEERTAIEQEYFADARALERLEAIEDDLIEDYLADRLDADERTSFERRYLAVPHRRRRIETVRALMAAAGQAAPAAPLRRTPVTGWLPLAAAALLVPGIGGWWLFSRGPGAFDTRDQQAATSPAPKPLTVPPPPQPKIFAFSLSPASVRSAGTNAVLVIPAGTNLVRLRLEGDAGAPTVERPRARIRTIAGGEVWRGPAAAANDAPAGTIAQIDLPAAHLPADDYVIELFGDDATGVEREHFRYFLAVRAR